MKKFFPSFKYRKIQLFTFFFILLSQFPYAQVTPQNRGKGALFLPTSQYNALPGPNWLEIKSFSTTVPNSDGSYTSPAIVMLNNPPVGDQQTQGSCVGWASGYSAMGILTYPKFNCWNNARRSPNYVYNQIKGGSNCGTGSYILDGVNLIKNQGDCSWILMPYNDADCAAIPSNFQTSDAASNKAINWAKLDKNDLNGIKQAISLGFPVVVGHFVYQSFYDMGNSTGIWTNHNGTNWGKHATCVVGYDDTRQQLKLQNQWGSSWGDNGCFWASYSFVEDNAFEEVYIIYGSTPSVPLAISGPSELCNNNVGSYNITSLSCNSPVTWSANISQVTISGYSNGTMVLNPNGFIGQVNISASVPTSTGNIQLVKQIQIGGPQGAGIVTYNYMQLCSDPYTERFSVLQGAGNYYLYSGTVECAASYATSARWSLVSYNGTGTWKFDDLGNGRCRVEAKTRIPVTSITLRFTASNACGNVTKDYTFSTSCDDISRQAAQSGSPPQIVISPNPNTGQFNISLNSTYQLATIKEIRIKNKMGTLVFDKKYNSPQSTQSVNISNQPGDVYIVEVFDGKNWKSQKINLAK